MTQTALEWERIGEGVATGFPQEVEGRLFEIAGPENVLELVERADAGEWEPGVLLAHEAGGTTLGPLLGDVVGVISTTGTLGAHIALLSKEYGCPCIVGTRLSAVPRGIERVRLDPDGTVWAVTG